MVVKNRYQMLKMHTELEIFKKKGLRNNYFSFTVTLSFHALKCSNLKQGFPGLPAMRETCVLSLGREGPLEKEMATHSSILAWRIPWMEEPGGLQSMGSQRVRYD